MRAASILTFLFAAGSIAMPFVKRQIDETVVTEIEYVDQNGNVVSTAYVTAAPTPVDSGSSPTTAPQAQAPAPAPAGPPPSAPSPPAAQPPAPAPSSPVQPSSVAPSSAPAPSPSPVGQSSTGSGQTSSESGAGGVSAYIQANGNDDTLYVGWVDPSDPKFGQIAVYHHNIHRANHSTTMVSYNESMAAQAQAWAEKCVTEEEVPEGSGMGMNVAFSSTTDNYNPSDWCTGSWYNSEIGNFPGYGQANLPVGDGTDFNSWGHFSQLVWPGVTQIGCGAYAGCGGGYTVHAGCYYYIEGNIVGSFNTVNPPIGGPIAYPNGQTSM